MKEVIVFSVVFQLHDLTMLVNKQNCFRNLHLNLTETGFGLMSKLHQALLRFLFDRTLIYRTKKIAMFLAHHAYKHSNMEALLGILKVVSGHRGTRDEMRLKLLDIAISLFSTNMEGPELSEKADAIDNSLVTRSLFPLRQSPCQEKTADQTYRGKQAVKAREMSKNNKGQINAIGRKNSTLNVARQKAMKVRFMKPELTAHPEENALTNGAENLKQETMVNVNMVKGKRDLNNSKQESIEMRSANQYDPDEVSQVEQGTHDLRKKVRKLWIEQNRIPILYSSDNEEKKTGEQARMKNVRGKRKRRTDGNVRVSGAQPTELTVRKEKQNPSSEIGVDGSSSCQHESIFITGGIQRNDYFARRVVLEFDPINNVYITHRAMRTSRYNHGIAQLNGEIYVVGGNSGCFEQLRVVESYCVDITQWSSQASMREARDEFSLVVCSGSLYAIGGHNGLHDLRTVERFDPEQGSWSFVSSMIHLRAGACSATVNDRYIFVAGGFNGDCYLDTVERYDTLTDTWTEVEPMKTNRAYSCLVLSQPDIYVLGGFDGDVTLSTCEVYDTSENRWNPVPDMNTSRMNAAAVLFRANIFIFGGETDGVFLGSVECYDIQNKTWAFIQRLPQPSAGLRACVYQGCAEAINCDDTAH